MKNLWNALLALIILIVFSFSSAVHAARSHQPAVPIEWKQESINWDQLETLFNQNPGFRNFSITFPNGMNWELDASVMRAMRLAYLHHAEVLGYKENEIPDLAFSSEVSKYKVIKGITTVPIEKFSDNLQIGEMDLLNELDNEKNGIWNSLPSWLQAFLTMIGDGLANCWNYLAGETKHLLR